MNKKKIDSKKLSKVLLIIIIIGILLGLFINNFIGIKDDFFTYVNEESLKKHELKDDEFMWSEMSDLQDEVDDETKKIMEDLRKTDKNVAALYNKLTNIK